MPQPGPAARLLAAVPRPGARGAQRQHERPGAGAHRLCVPERPGRVFRGPAGGARRPRRHVPAHARTDVLADDDAPVLCARSAVARGHARARRERGEWHAHDHTGRPAHVRQAPRL